MLYRADALLLFRRLGLRCDGHPPPVRSSACGPHSGGLDGQLGGADGDQEALVLLIRGVGSHLDVPARETRLRGMRVGEAVSELGGHSLRFDELDGEREERRRRRRRHKSGSAAPAAAEKAEDGKGGDVDGLEESGAGTAATAKTVAEGGTGVSVSEERQKTPRKKKSGSKGRTRDKGNAVRDSTETVKRRGRRGLPAGWGGGEAGEDDGDSDLDPDMLLPLGGEESGSDSDAEHPVRSV